MKSLYNIDPSHSSANFSVKHMMIAKVHGGFEKISGKFAYDPQNLKESSVEAAIEVASINTRDAQRDTHLRSADFFEVEKYPLMTFKSTEFKHDGNNNLMVTGDLTIRDVTKKVTLVVDEQSAEHKDPWGNLRIGLSAKTKVNRKDFGLTWNAALEAGGVLVGDEITITLDVQFVKEVK
ncbi:YceI family protein [Peredibacter sp. HCB2-198]|uniref:YceI family protein n=1 Tax=Peredibacter sp. HCB2-198 TaxID=3383025 RepID=UPI0038B5F2C7